MSGSLLRFLLVIQIIAFVASCIGSMKGQLLIGAVVWSYTMIIVGVTLAMWCVYASIYYIARKKNQEDDVSQGVTHYPKLSQNT